MFPYQRTQSDSSALHAAAFEGPTYLSKTENGTDDDGGDWTTRKILDLGRNDQTIANQIAVLPRTLGRTQSTLINVFDSDPQRQQAGPQGREDLRHVVDRLWRHVVGSGRHRFARGGGSVRHRPRRRALPRAVLGNKQHPGTPARCARPRVYQTSRSTWTTARRTSPGRTVARTARCKFGWRSRATTARPGRSWASSTRFPGTDAHTPSVVVDEEGTVAVSYYDYRFNDVDSNDGLETAYCPPAWVMAGRRLGPMR